MTKVFISQPMNGMPQESILMRRDMLERKVKSLSMKYIADDEIYILDSFIENAKDVNALFCLGHAIQVLSKADIAVFAKGWEFSRGCRVEHLCAEMYGIEIIYERFIDEFKN